ncbi:MAG: hypothetical protein GF388_10465 [Candidatus Aegiribacteria sp.]|nr:hypothetical protein [Candidatus Aegiribacteria sp.]MBD3295446.1 hypothetical protein [Candidatus Fermentibacteria bacterium]
MCGFPLSLKELETAGRRFLTRHLLSRFQPRQVLGRIPEGREPGRILLMRWDAIGDLMVCLPYFRKVRDLFPESQVGIVVSRRNRIILKHEEGFSRILYDSAPGVYIQSVLQARRFQPDALVDTRMHYDSTTSFIYGLLSGAEWMLSAENRDNRLPFSIRVPMPEGRLHNADMTRILLEGLGKPIPDSDLDRPPVLSAVELDFAGAFWRRCGLNLRGRAVGVNISARNPLHRWSDAKTASLCRELLSMGRTPVLFWAPWDRERAMSIASAASGTLTAPRTPTILHSAALIKDLGLFVTPDTGILHIASSFGVPIIGLYKSNEEHLPTWYPWRVENIVLEDAESVDGIEVPQVVRGIGELSSSLERIELDL